MLKASQLLLVLAIAPISLADIVTLVPTADATLYEGGEVESSNGGGVSIFGGVTRDGNRRRALITFDFSQIPAGSTINSVSLRLVCTRQIVGEPVMTLHRVTASWGEGAVDAGEPGGQGAPASPGDATWSSRFLGTTLWAAPGGDFDPAVLASQTVSLTGPYVWSGAGLTAAVQAWIDGSAPNEGLMLRGDEANSFNAKRFGSRESASMNESPMLTIDFTPPPPPLCEGDANGDQQVNFADVTDVLANFGASYLPALNGLGDANHDGVVNFADVTAVLSAFGSPCT